MLKPGLAKQSHGSRPTCECRLYPLSGIGKPERLKADLSGYWSRRIDSEHRFVYSVHEDGIIIVSCRYHYRE
ncbi:MAG: Txe/YoeB family addiction module toxin [Anaerolinea sp.]|nr:Txe/YoeB family addiction module toxin [Anaerolinea sp.]